MKKEKVIFLAVAVFSCVTILFVSCAKKTTSVEPYEEVSSVGEPLATESASAAQQNIDVDLTVMSSTMVYAEVFNMLIEPEQYVGKTVKMSGDFFVYKPVLADGTESDRNFYACVIADATACCVQGMEFSLEEIKKYPEEYPEQGSQITVVGTFEIYEELGVSGIRIKDAKLI